VRAVSQFARRIVRCHYSIHPFFHSAGFSAGNMDTPVAEIIFADNGKKCAEKLLGSAGWFIFPVLQRM
jgi:hypothetical protein